MTITNTCIFDPPLYMIEKTFLSYCKLSFKYLIKVYFSYGSVLMKEMQKSTTTWFLPFVQLFNFWNNTRYFMLTPDDIQIMLGKKFKLSTHGS